MKPDIYPSNFISVTVHLKKKIFSWISKYNLIIANNVPNFLLNLIEVIEFSNSALIRGRIIDQYNIIVASPEKIKSSVIKIFCKVWSYSFIKPTAIAVSAIETIKVTGSVCGLFFIYVGNS